MRKTELSRRSFVKYVGAAGAACLASAALAGCGQGGSQSGASASSGSAAGSSASSASVSSSGAAPVAVGGNSVVVFFSRAGENYDVGYVDQGNTSIVAYSIAGKIVSDVFEIIPVEPYPEGYEDCTVVGRNEQREKARPAYVGDLENFDSYDVVYLGYPIWWEDMPMIVYSFLESHDWSGKTIVPFCTYGSSGLCATDKKLQSVCPGATVTEALALAGSVAQNDSSQVNKAVNEWLAKVRG